MRRMLLVLAALVTVGAVVVPAASAHPLGNFSINHLSTVSVSEGRVQVRYVLDQAEIPTVQERSLSRAELIERKRDEVAQGLHLRVDGRELPLRVSRPVELSFPAGAGGLDTSRFVFTLTAAVEAPRRVSLSDETFADRVGWKAIVAAPGEGTTVRTDAPSGDPTNGLRRYPDDLLNSPLDRREASFSVKPGPGTLIAPRSEGAEFTTSRSAGDGFAGLFEDAAAGEGVLVLLLLAAFGWGALHALSPGHGKAMVAAYLVGTRGKARHAVALGATVTVAHTIGVFALGFVTLALSQYVLPEDLYPWLNLVSGLLVVGIGAAVLRSRMRWARDRRAAADAGLAVSDELGPSPDAGHSHAHSHPHPHPHPHDHSHAHGQHTHGKHTHSDGSHAHDHGHAHGGLLRGGLAHMLDHVRGRPHGHEHRHTHAHEHSQGHGPGHAHHHPPSADDHTVTTRSLLGLGAAAGLIPCPSALVVLLGAISQHEIALGLLLIVAFSLGLAGTLTALGVAVVYARQLLPRLKVPRVGRANRVVASLPAASALVIVVIGCVLTANAVPTLV